MADALEGAAEVIVAANHKDVQKARADGLAAPLLDRLHLDRHKLATAVDGVRQIAAMDDPVGRTLRATELDDGLRLWQVTCPLGVLACIFESRPDVVIQISALSIRSANAVLLKGGKEARHTNEALVDAVREAVAEAGLPEDAVQLLAGRGEVQELLALDDLVDLVIPRGSNELVRHIQERTRIPVLGHAEGVCHVYVDAAADLEMATGIVLDAKLDYPAACNAVETVLVHDDHAAWLPRLRALLEEKGVTVHEADADWRREYGGPELNLGTVAGLDAAVAHINRYGSHHTDAIVTDDPARANRFLANVDAAGVYWNASTRFADGYRYGLGAEVGISTGKIHARGPVGLEGLVSTRWLLAGHGHVAATYREKSFHHRPIDAPFPMQEAEHVVR